MFVLIGSALDVQICRRYDPYDTIQRQTPEVYAKYKLFKHYRREKWKRDKAGIEDRMEESYKYWDWAEYSKKKI